MIQLIPALETAIGVLLLMIAVLLVYLFRNNDESQRNSLDLELSRKTQDLINTPMELLINEINEKDSGMFDTGMIAQNKRLVYLSEFIRRQILAIKDFSESTTQLNQRLLVLTIVLVALAIVQIVVTLMQRH